MTKKTLEQKIKLIGFWTFSGVFWYMVISFFLLSDYPIQEQPFNHKRAYEVIKDALGLAAAFLAPVAAFVLFSDWREQHILTTNERLSINILEKVVKLDGLLFQGYNIHAKDCEEWEVFKDSFIKLLKEIREKKEKINLLNDDAVKLKSNLETLNFVVADYFLAHCNAVKYKRKELSLTADSDLQFTFENKASEYGSQSAKLAIRAKSIIREIKILDV